MNLRTKNKRQGEVHTSALNDILFILLFFFLIVSTLANPNVVKLTQPKGESDTRAKQTVVVSINSEKQYYIGQIPISVRDLQEKLKPFVVPTASNPNPVIVINADKTVPIENVVFVMTVAKKLGVKTVLAVKKPAEISNS